MGLCASRPKDHAEHGHKPVQPSPVDAQSDQKPSKPVPAKAGQQQIKVAGVGRRNRVLDSDTQEVTELYTLGKVLGRGQFGTTRLATEKATGQTFACKSISKRKLLSKEDIEDVRREVQILHHLGGHPNITQLKGAYEDRHSVHLVMELCEGGELFDRIVSRGHYSEKDAATMVRTMVKVVGHCHALGVIHRDLKPENFLLVNQSEDSPLKGCDFGLSVFFRPDEIFTDIVGSAYYVAPEVLRRKYGKEADIWSTGVILYILLSGVPPFWGETEQQIFDSILKGKLDFASDPWPRISDDAKDCLRRMLQQDPKRRATANEILQHSWMKEHGTASSAPLDNIILKRMQGFSAMNKLKRQALMLIASSLAPEELAGLRAIFQAIDIDKSGTITVEEMKQGLKSQGSVVTETELNNLMQQLDANKDGTIDYEEFVAGTINLAHLNKSDNLAIVFEQFDENKDGVLSREELTKALKSTGVDVSNEVQKIIDEVDTNGDGQIDYEEFCHMMNAGNEEIISSKSTLRRQRAEG